MRRWGKRFLSSTRGQVVELLRRGKASVSELAGTLKLTDNAIRSHLATLERDGLVHQAGKRPGVRKPETLYALTDEAEQLFPKAYHLLLNELLSALERRLPRAEIDDVLREVGQRLADGAALDAEATPLRERVEKAVGILNNMGGLAELQETDAGFVIRGCSCPLAATVNEHPQACQLAEALVAAIVGQPVQEICERNGTPRCAFQIRAEETLSLA